LTAIISDALRRKHVFRRAIRGPAIDYKKLTIGSGLLWIRTRLAVLR